MLVDTNVLLKAADQTAAEHLACFQLLEDLRRNGERWFTTWPILNEFLRLSTHPRVFKKPWQASAAWTFVEAILASPGHEILAPSPRHSTIVAQILKEMPDLHGNIFHDLHTAVLLREHGFRRIYTYDNDFLRFRFLQV
ncbi:MAG: TA system VapC family ribonuclease toxin, partial [Thermoanaerobaculia bacterium]